MRESELTKFLVTISGQIEHVRFPGGVFDNEVYLQYETVWGPDWEVMSGLTSGTSQMARSGCDPERIIFNVPIEIVFSSTNISGLTISGQIEHVRFPGGVFDNEVYLQYETVWGPDWEVMSGLTSGTSQMARSGCDPERIIFNVPIEIVFSSTNISGWPQIVITVRANNSITGDSLRGYALFLCPTTAGPRDLNSHIFRPRSSTLLGEWMSWITGKYPELIDPKMLASGKDNYLLRTESYGSVKASLTMVSKDLRRLGYDNQPPPRMLN